jgi:surface polysaccharide O-acyltransferase-like enzyme
MTERDTGLDVLRVTSAFAVVWLHVSANVVGANPDVHNASWWVGNVADSLSRWSIPVFVMVSGSLLLSRPSAAKPREFYRRRAERLLPPLLIWTAVFIGVRAYQHDQFTTREVAKSILQGTPYSHLWYLYMILGLYAATPFIRQIVTASSPQMLRIFLYGGFAIASIDSMTAAYEGRTSITFLGLFLPYVAYFVVGDYLRAKNGERRSARLLLLALVCAILVSLLAGLLLPTLGSKAFGIAYSNFDPLVIVMALCIFRMVTSVRFRPGRLIELVRRMAPLTLGIYVVHPLWLLFVPKLGIRPTLINPLVGIPVTTLTVFSLSLASTVLIAAIPGVRVAVHGLSSRGASSQAIGPSTVASSQPTE